MSTPVRFEDEADAEYREAGRWYDAKQTGLGIEFFRRLAVTRFPYHVIYLEPTDELRILAFRPRSSQTWLLEEAPEVNSSC